MASVVLLFSILTAKPAWTATVEDLLRDARGNKTLLNSEIIATWANNPEFRGTADILWSCLITLTACVYTAIHLNIPTTRKSKWRRIWSKVYCALAALIGPELVLSSAWTQFRDAQRLCKNLNKIRTKKWEAQDGSETTKIPPKDFDSSYGYWVAMGGFVVDVRDMHDKLTRFAINPKGIEFLADAGIFLEISQEQIEDRSKANVLAKSLVCFQVTWMLIQCIARKSAGYPLSLLEIHTMVHVVCALLIYILWWQKPLDIAEPEVVDTTAYHDLIAFLLTGSNQMDSLGIYNEASYLNYNSSIYKSTDWLKTGEQATAAKDAQNEGDDESTRVRTASIASGDPSKQAQLAGLQYENDGSVLLQKGSSLPGGLSFVDTGSFTLPNKDEIRLSSKGVRRLEFAAAGIRRIEQSQDSSKVYRPEDERVANLIACEGLGLTSNFFLSDLKNRDRYYRLLRFFGDFGRLFTVVVLAILYGGVHLTAWNYSFPSRVEHIIWKLSSIGIMGGSPAIFLATAMTAVVCEIGGIAKVAGLVVSVGLMASSFIFHIFCRIYLVVEAFISLRHVPLGVYAAVPWVQNIPHI